MYEEFEMREYFLEMSDYYRTPHLLMVVGSDMNFEKAEYYYQQLQRTMDQFNKLNDDIQISFSTLSYYDEMVGKHDEELASFYYDMMPHSEKGVKWFTGLFSSRPNLKSAIREASRTYHAANKLYLSKVLDRDPGWGKK